jgi:pimeloyl-ACP methyl ester carboxylesterase
MTSYLTAAGHRLEYAWLGPDADEAPTLVFLHEGLGSLTTWKDFPDEVAAITGCGAFLYSRWGYGKSDPRIGPCSEHYLRDEALTALPEVLRQMEIQQPILIGHSDGASLALIYTGEYSNGVRGLVLEAPHVFVEDIMLAGIKRTGLLYESTDLPQRLARYHGDQADAVFQNWYHTWLGSDFRRWNIEASLPAIRSPLLIIQGEDDEYGSVKQVDAIRTQVSGSVEVQMLPDCGHAPHRDQGEATINAIIRFVRDLI